MPRVSKTRVDQRLVTLGLAPTRAKAQALVLAGSVYLGDQRVDKSGTLVAEDAPLTVRGSVNPYVSRGGVKLAGAIDAFPSTWRGGAASTSARRPAASPIACCSAARAHVAAVDVGYGQLASTIAQRSRACSSASERTRARSRREDIGGAVDLTVVDASFIGLGKLLAAIARCTREGGQLLALVKPQFEVGREEVSKTKGVVRDRGAARDGDRARGRGGPRRRVPHPRRVRLDAAGPRRQRRSVHLGRDRRA